MLSISSISVQKVYIHVYNIQFYILRHYRQKFIQLHSSLNIKINEEWYVH